MQARIRVRQVANTVNLSTLLGLAVAAGARCPVHRGPDGLFLAVRYRPALPHAAAFTLGNVVLVRSELAEAVARPALIGHEARHSSQYALCLGLPFLPLYAAAALWSWWRTGDPASRNAFERHAGLRAGGYIERPLVVRWPHRRITKT